MLVNVGIGLLPIVFIKIFFTPGASGHFDGTVQNFVK